VFHVRVPAAAMGPELRHLSQGEIGFIGTDILRALQRAMRDVRTARRGPPSNPRDVIFGRPEDREPFG
jgi:hypothetical protein